jgi:DNA modification methylase
MLTLTCEDCMNLMPRYPDGHFDLAIVDPPLWNRGGLEKKTLEKEPGAYV